LHLQIVGFSEAWKRTDSLPRRTAEANPQANPQGCGLAQAQTQADDQQEAGLAITHYKKGFTLDICSTFSNARKRPKFQRSASGL
jgi:hypothetical protein